MEGMSNDYSRIMRGGKSTGEIRRFAEEADLRKGSKELYKVMEKYAKARAVAKRLPGFDEECERLEHAFRRALYDCVVGRYKSIF